MLYTKLVYLVISQPAYYTTIYYCIHYSSHLYRARISCLWWGSTPSRTRPPRTCPSPPRGPCVLPVNNRCHKHRQIATRITINRIEIVYTCKLIKYTIGVICYGGKQLDNVVIGWMSITVVVESNIYFDNQPIVAIRKYFFDIETYLFVWPKT